MNSPVPSVDVAQLAQALAGGAVLIDVREPDEYETVRAQGATLIPLGEVIDRVDEFPETAQFFVICHLGGRSMKAAQWLRSQGLDAVNVTGGTDAWLAAGLPTASGSASE